VEARARLFTQLHKLAGLSPAERLRIIALIYLESGVDAAREAARLANIPATSVDRRGRWALVEGDRAGGGAGRRCGGARRAAGGTYGDNRGGVRR